MNPCPFKLLLTRDEAAEAGLTPMTVAYHLPSEWHMLAHAAGELAKAKTIRWALVETEPGGYEIWRHGMRQTPEEETQPVPVAEPVPQPPLEPYAVTTTCS